VLEAAVMKISSVLEQNGSREKIYVQSKGDLSSADLKTSWLRSHVEVLEEMLSIALQEAADHDRTNVIMIWVTP
jgi:DNA-binding protein YbaB